MVHLRVSIALAFVFINLWFIPAQTTLPDHFKESYKLETEGKYKEASETLKKVYQEDSYEINLRLGWLTYHAGSFSESIAFYNKAIAIRPLGIEPRLGLVLPLSALGNWDQIIDQYSTILEIDPQNSVVNYRMGAIYYERKNFEKAEYHCKKVVNLYPFDHASLLLLAWIKLEQGNTNEAKLLFNKVLLNNPGDKSALQGLSLLEK